MCVSSARTSILVRALGVGIRIDCEDEDLAWRVRAAWSDALDLGGGGPTSVLTAGMAPRNDVTGRDVEEVLHHLSPAVTTQAIAARAGQLVMLHAAALAEPETGAAAVLVAASGTGKTTAAATLGRHFEYISDETSAIDSDGLLVPHRKPLSIVRSGHIKEQVSASSLGLLTSDRPARLRAMLVLQRDPDHHEVPEVAVLETIDALALLAPQASSLGRLARPLHRLVSLIERVGGVRHVKYAEAASLESVVHGLLESA